MQAREEDQCSIFSDLRICRSKLDGAVAKNIQTWELLNANTLQTVFTNALQVAMQFRPYGSKAKFYGKKCDPVVAVQARTGQQIRIKLATIARTQVMMWTIAYIYRNIRLFWHIRIGQGKG